MNRRRQTLDKRRLPLLIVGSLIGLIVLTVCAAPPPRGTVQSSLAQPTITAVGNGPTATPIPPIPVNDTLVKRVRALQTVPIFGGPSKQYVTVGVIAKDATVPVTGISLDGAWWRVPCDVRSQIRNQVDCWVEADPLITGPVDEPATAAPVAVAPAATETPAPQALAAPAATDTAVPVPTDTPAAAPTATEAALAATATEAPAASTATEAAPAATATEAAPAPTATEPAPAATATKAAPAPTATKVPPTATTAPTPLPSPTAAPPTPTSVAIDLKPTNIQFIITLLEVQVLDAPQSGAVIGSYAAGKKVEVTGYTSADGLWWRVVCPTGDTGNCFVTADPTYTSPAVAPK
jgi:hypothetical protein